MQTREIKFRIWQEDLATNDRFYMVAPGYVDDWQVKELNYDAGIAMQYTGLIDMNGIDVYEGDIVKVTNPLTKSSVIRNIWWNGELAKFNGFPSGHSRVFEVIGNIYSNPELIKEKE